MKTLLAAGGLFLLAVTALGQSTTAPVITRITPEATVEGTGSLTLTVEGTNFGSAARVRINGADRTTTFVSSTRLTANLLAIDVNSDGTSMITVFSGGRVSNAVAFTVLPNDPRITSLDPTTVAAGTGEFTLRVTGQNFAQTATVRVNGSARSTTWVSTTTLDARILASDIASARTLQISVANPNAQFSPNFAFVVSATALTPEITSLSPSEVQAGGADFTLSIVGRNFHPDAQVRIGSLIRTPTFIDGQHLQLLVTRQQIATAGTLNVVVVNPGNRASAASPLLVTTNVTPTITTITPQTLTVNTRDLLITVEGTNFESGAFVRVGGANRTTTFVSSTRLTATLQTADVSAVRELSITVKNPTAEGRESLPKLINVVGLNAPVVTSISPSSLVVNTSNLRLLVNGTGFMLGDVVQIGGAPRLTDFIGATQLAATLLPEDVAATGEFSLTVRKSNGVSSAPFLFRVIDSATPFIASLSPAVANVNGNPFTLRILGENFAPDSTVSFNGIVRSHTFVSSTELTVAVTAADLAVPQTIAVTVRNAAGDPSAAVNLAVIELLPEILTIDPVSVIAGDAGFTLTVAGTNFGSTGIINLGGLPMSSTRFNSSNGTLSVIVPSSLITSAGTLAVSVTDRGSTSAAVALQVLAPSVANVSPRVINAGSDDVTVTVTGSSFLPTSRVSFKGGERVTTYVSPTQLTAVLPASALLEPGEVALVVVNTPEAISAPLLISIVPPGPPVIAAFVPGFVVAGSGSFELIVTGANFLPGARVRVNGQERQTTFLSTTELRTTLTAADVASAGTLNITVANTTGDPSAVAAFRVEAQPATGPRRRSARH